MKGEELKLKTVLRKMWCMVVVLLFASCTNHNTVNVLITNNGDTDITDKVVRVPLDEVRSRLQVTCADTLIVLNEQNLPVDYGFSADSLCLVFHVPIIKKNSQKTYSINRSHSRLSDNLLRFRRGNIMINVE